MVWHGHWLVKESGEVSEDIRYFNGSIFQVKRWGGTLNELWLRRVEHQPVSWHSFADSVDAIDDFIFYDHGLTRKAWWLALIVISLGVVVESQRMDETVDVCCLECEKQWPKDGSRERHKSLCAPLWIYRSRGPIVVNPVNMNESFARWRCCSRTWSPGAEAEWINWRLLC